MSRGPYPFEVGLESGLTLRGLEYPQDGPPVVLVHDQGGDADSWRDVPGMFVSAGFRAINLESRGHGLSDGEMAPDILQADLTEALGIIGGSFGPVGLIACGTAATICLTLGREDSAPVHVLVSPLPHGSVDPSNSVPAMRAIFSGTGDAESDSFVRSHYQRLAGQNMWFSTAAAEHGPDLLESKPHMIEQATTFLRRYLIGFHLAWAAEQPSDEESADDKS